MAERGSHVIARVPGRVNLIGDHTDYQDGWCLPMTIDRELRLTYHAWRTLMVDGVAPEWLAALSPPKPFTGSVASTIPIGSGLSSSAALAVALCMAGTDARGRDLALAAQSLEQR